MSGWVTRKEYGAVRRVLLLISLLFVIVVVMTVSPALAQSAGEAGDQAARMRWFDFFVVKGGAITYLLIALSVVTISLAVEHAFSIRRSTIAPDESVLKIKALLGERKYVEAIRYTAEEPTMLGHVLNSGLIEAANGYDAMLRAVQESLDDRASRLFRKIEYLNVIGNVSPMIGLFGTVYGMILLFAEIHQRAEFPPPQVVADKISIALITTFWGLAVAIPALSIFAIFRNRIDVLAAECAIVSEKLLSIFKPGGEAMVAAQAPRAKG